MAVEPGLGSKDSRGPVAGLYLILVLTLAMLGGCATQPPPISQVAVSSSQPLATQAGLRALEQGGNAFDAAIAVASVLAVVEPYDASLGSSSFFLVHTDTGHERFIDGGYAAPAGFTGSSSMAGAAAAAIPGEPAALVYLSQHYAERPLEADLSDAIRLARSGILPDSRYRTLARQRLAALQQKGQPLLLHGKLPPEGKRLQQNQLADTLSRLANLKDAAFYNQTTARRAAQVGAHWRAADLKTYRVSDRAPLQFQFGNNTLLAAPEPSQAGPTLAQMLALAHASPLSAGVDQVGRIHHFTEVMRLAQYDSIQNPGLPLDQLVTPLHLNYLAGQIDPRRAHPLPALQTRPLSTTDYATSFTVVDARGNRVVASLSLHRPFGCGTVLPGTGILLNDALSGARANTHGHLATQLTPVTLQTPELTLMTGSGGEMMSPDALFLGLERVLEGMPVDKALATPRYQGQLFPPGIVLEKGAADSRQRTQLRHQGYQLKTAAKPLGRLDWVSQEAQSNRLQAGTDPRGQGQGLVESN